MGTNAHLLLVVDIFQVKMPPHFSEGDQHFTCKYRLMVAIAKLGNVALLQLVLQVLQLVACQCGMLARKPLTGIVCAQ